MIPYMQIVQITLQVEQVSPYYNFVETSSRNNAIYIWNEIYISYNVIQWGPIDQGEQIEKSSAYTFTNNDLISSSQLENV